MARHSNGPDPMDTASPATGQDFRREFVEFAIRTGVLRFGEFRTKAGRLSPYFFNAGLFHDGQSLGELSRYYAQAALASGIAFDLIFGPAYKGITLAAATAVALAQMGHNVPFSYNRKESKDHGEGGNIVGAPLRGRVLVIDDVISAGTSVRESEAMIRAAGAVPAGVLIALDRQERGLGSLSATQEVSRSFGIPVTAIATLDDVLATLRARADLRDRIPAIEEYRRQYGA
jgi:orotate phosphoribosyltransferase